MDAQASGRGDHQNVARAALVIEVLARARERGLRLTDVVEETGLGTATVHRLLTGLATHGFIDHDKANNRYFVGLRLISWAAAATERYGLAPFVDGSLERLCAETEDTVYFSIVSGSDAVCVDRREGAYPIKTLTLSVGDRRPLGIGAGSLALLAFQPDERVAALLAGDEERRQTFAISTAFLEEEIANVRRRGYALNEGRLIPGMSGVAVAIRRSDGTAVGALSVAAVTTRLTGERLDHVVGLLKEEAGRIEATAAEALDAPFIKRYSGRKA